MSHIREPGAVDMTCGQMERNRRKTTNDAKVEKNEILGMKNETLDTALSKS